MTTDDTVETTGAKTLPRLKTRYREEIAPALRKRLLLRRTSCRRPVW